SDSILPLREIEQTAFFDEVLRPQGIGHSAMIGLAKQPDFGVAFSLNRGPRQGPYGEAELRFLRRLTPHMQRSMQLGLRIGAYKALQRAEHSTLDLLSVGVILLDRQGKIVYANAAARAFDSPGGALRLRQGKVAHLAAGASREIDELVQSALRGTPMA